MNTRNWTCSITRLAISQVLRFFRLKPCKTAGIPAAFLLPAILVLCGSCARLPGKLLVMEGGFFNARGMYTEAASAYLRALAYGEAAPYAEYGLGFVCLQLGEGDAALERFAASEKALAAGAAENRELLYRIRYNRGVVLFEKGNFDGAAGAFRAALETDGSRIEAKRNLELSLLSRAQKAAGGGESPSRRNTGSAAADDHETGEKLRNAALYEYLRQKEKNQWESREWIEEESGAELDY
jgi:Ca-activated chloride channel family protein